MDKCLKIIGSVLQEALIIVNVFVVNFRDSKYMKQNLLKLKAELDIYNYSRDFDNSLSMTDKQIKENNNTTIRLEQHYQPI